jgi:hypothetical protein
MTAITAERLRELLDYDPETGVFTWRTSRSRNAKAGEEAGYNQIAHTGRLYRVIKIDGKSMKAHRLAWLHVHGIIPSGDLDHIDGNGLNNSLSNLRQASRAQNGANRGLNANNTSGAKGVLRSANKWRARIVVSGKLKHLGYFRSSADAAEAYAQAAKKYFGEFARTA